MLLKNRSSIDIVNDVLSIASVKVRKTRIMYRANLSFLQLEKYLSALVRRGLLAYDGESSYFVTGAGLEFQKLYEDYMECSKRLGREIKRNTEDRQQLESMCGFRKNDSKKCYE